MGRDLTARLQDGAQAGRTIESAQPSGLNLLLRLTKILRMASQREPRNFGSRMSRSESPKRFSERTVIVRAMPGKIAIHGALVM